MGTKCGPSIANLYIACLEEKFLKIHRPLSYYRFIDDIFLVTSESFNIDYLKNSFGYLKLNIVCENIVNFLDLNISICKITNRLVFSLYIKPTNTFSYLLTESNHPNFIFKNIPKGLFFRIRRICTNLFEYFYFSRKLIIQLLQRGYRFDTLNKTMIMVSKLERQDLLVYKEKNRKFENSQLLIVPFDNNNLNIFKIIKKNLYKLSLSNESFAKQKFSLVHSMLPSISSLFIHNFRIESKPRNSYSICNNSKCKICIFSLPNSTIILNKFPLPILSNSNCKSVNCVYILLCTFCSSFYVGQTKNLEERIKTHLRSIRLNRSSSNCKCVFNHFNQKSNSINNFKFLVFKTDIIDLKERMNLEGNLIYLFKVLDLKLLNESIPDIINYRNGVKLFN